MAQIHVYGKAAPASRAAVLALLVVGLGHLGTPAGAQGPARLVVVAADGLAPPVIDILEVHRRDHPNAVIEVKGQTTGGGLAELIDGRASLLVTVHPWTEADRAAFIARLGYEPFRLKVATAHAALHVYRDNPLEGLSQREVDAIFSRNLRCGARAPAEVWRDVGVEAPVFAARPIAAYVPADLAGIVRARLLCGGDFGPDVGRMPSVAAAIEAVSRDPDGIAVAPLIERVGVKTLPLVEVARSSRIPADDGDPLRWDVYVYVNRPSLEGLPPPVHEFLRTLVGSAGRDAFARAGIEPVATAEARQAWEALGAPAVDR
jgi:phosphate transport system substrate-binding protein